MGWRQAAPPNAPSPSTWRGPSSCCPTGCPAGCTGRKGGRCPCSRPAHSDRSASSSARCSGTAGGTSGCTRLVARRLPGDGPMANSRPNRLTIVLSTSRRRVHPRRAGSTLTSPSTILITHCPFYRRQEPRVTTAPEGVLATMKLTIGSCQAARRRTAWMPKICLATENRRYQFGPICQPKARQFGSTFLMRIFCQPSISHLAQSAKLLRFRSKQSSMPLVMHCIRAGVPASTRTQRIGQS